MGGDPRKDTRVWTQGSILGWGPIPPSEAYGWVGPKESMLGCVVGPKESMLGCVGGDPLKHIRVGTQESMVGGNPRKHTGMLKGTQGSILVCLKVTRSEGASWPEKCINIFIFGLKNV